MSNYDLPVLKLCNFPLGVPCAILVTCNKKRIFFPQLLKNDQLIKYYSVVIIVALVVLWQLRYILQTGSNGVIKAQIIIVFTKICSEQNYQNKHEILQSKSFSVSQNKNSHCNFHFLRIVKLISLHYKSYSHSQDYLSVKEICTLNFKRSLSNTYHSNFVYTNI